MGIFSAYGSLNAEQKQILKEKKIDADRPVDELIKLLKPVAACDAAVDKSKTKLGCTAGLALVASIILFFTFLNIGWSLPTRLIYGAILTVLLVTGYLWLWMRRIDVSNNFRDFAIPVLTVLREDFDPTRPPHVHLDLSSPTDKTKKQSESAPYAAGAYYKVIDSMYLDPWMSVEGTLVDGSRISWNVIDSIRERKKTKRNPRGKIKTKTKVSKKTHLEVDVGLPKKKYAPGTPPGAEITDNGKRNSVHLERTVRSDSLNPIAPNALIDMVADIYRTAKREAQA